MKYATAISPESMNATGRVNRPSSSNRLLVILRAPGAVTPAAPADKRKRSDPRVTCASVDELDAAATGGLKLRERR